MPCEYYATTPVLGNQKAQHSFPFDKRNLAQVFAVDPEQIERIEERGGSTEQQFVELAMAVAIQTDYLTIQDGVIRSQLIRDCLL